jgi:hypothetical protein
VSEGCVTIDRIANGYTVSMRDPKLVKKNQKPGPWVDPCKKYSFDTLEKTLDFLKKNLDKALPEEDYDTAFETASAEADEKRSR